MGFNVIIEYALPDVPKPKSSKAKKIPDPAVVAAISIG